MRRCQDLLETSHYGSGLSEASFWAQAALLSSEGPVMTSATPRHLR